MKFLTFNIVVLGALYFLYQFGGGTAATRPEAALEPARQVESSPQEQAAMHALSDRIAVLAQSVARLEDHVSEVVARGETDGGAPAANTNAAAAQSSRAPATSAEDSPGKPRPDAPKRPAAAPAEGRASYARANEAEAQEAAPPVSPNPPPHAERVGETRVSEFDAGSQVAAREVGSEWSDGGATGAPAHRDATGDSWEAAAQTPDVPVIDGELMSPSQRRNALLQLAQDMELQYLMSAGE
jgi:hypothetical protein